MEEVIGTRGTPGHGSLMEFGVTYRGLDLLDGKINWKALATAVIPGARVGGGVGGEGGRQRCCHARCAGAARAAIMSASSCCCPYQVQRVRTVSQRQERQALPSFSAHLQSGHQLHASYQLLSLPKHLLLSPRQLLSSPRKLLLSPRG